MVLSTDIGQSLRYSVPSQPHLYARSRRVVRYANYQQPQAAPRALVHLAWERELVCMGVLSQCLWRLARPPHPDAVPHTPPQNCNTVTACMRTGTGQIEVTGRSNGRPGVAFLRSRSFTRS